MDKLSIFTTSASEVELISEGGKSLDSLTDGLDAIVGKQGDVLRQLEATHMGFEEEDWGRRYEVEDIEALEEEE